MACTGTYPNLAPATLALADAQACVAVNESNGGGAIITFAAGSITWAGTLNIARGVTLVGAGIDVTTITDNSQMIDMVPSATAIANEEPIKITGFTFDGNNTATIFMHGTGASGISGTKPYRYYVIGNNKFKNQLAGTSNGVLTIAGPGDNGQLRGVIYGNTFDRCDIILRSFSNDDTGESGNATFNAPTLGNEDTLYFEDNTIQYSSAYSASNPGWSETGQGARLVQRYNTWDFTNATGQAELNDIHGFQNWAGVAGGGQTGTMASERYANTYSNASGIFRMIDHRGGIGMFFNNLLSGSANPDIELYGMSTPGSCSSDINPVPTNYNPTVHNSYFFNNTVGGTEKPATMNALGNPIHCTVAENSNYDPLGTGTNGGWWNLNTGSCTSAACTVGIGRGTTAPTGTCTVGTGYWVAPTATPTTSSAVNQAAAFYICTATNTWTLQYQPFTYPHPLRSVSSNTPAIVFVTPASDISLGKVTTGKRQRAIRDEMLRWQENVPFLPPFDPLNLPHDDDGQNRLDWGGWRVAVASEDDTPRLIILPSLDFSNDADQQQQWAAWFSQVASQAGQDNTQFIILPLLTLDNDATQQRALPPTAGAIASRGGEAWTQFIVLPPPPFDPQQLPLGEEANAVSPRYLVTQDVDDVSWEFVVAYGSRVVRLTGGGFQDALGNPLANGYLVMQLGQDESARVGLGQLGRLKVKIALDANGNVASSQGVWPNDLLVDPTSFYFVSAYNALGQRVFGPSQQQVLSSPSPFDLSAWTPQE